MLTLYGRHASPFVRRVAITLKLYDLPYDHRPLMPFGPDKAVLARVNPIARVPALQLPDGEVLTDSTAIIDHLDQTVGPARALTPAAGPQRRRVLALLAVALGANEKLVAALYERHFRPRAHQYEPWIAACEKQVGDGFVWLDAQLADRTWFVGEGITQADVTVAVFWQFAQGKRPGFCGRMGCGNLDRLAVRMQEQPAFVATVPEEERLTDDLG